jgi:hypothetical protein
MADTDEIQPSSIRIAPDLKAAVIRRAEAEGRTFSQHVVWLLRKHVESTPEPGGRKQSKSRKA